MSFSLDKCGGRISKTGKVITTGGADLPEGTIANVEENKYFGFPQANRNNEEATRRSATTKYLKSVRLVLKSQLNGKNKVQHQHIHPANHQIPHNNLAKRENRSH